MGRLTPSFRTVYSEVLDDLRKEIRNCFVDINHKEAFDLLYKEAWRPEEAAMGNSTLPTVLDKLCMVANINTRKLIELIKAEISIKDTKIQALQQMIDSLEAEDKQSGSTPRCFNEFSHLNLRLQSYVHISRYRICYRVLNSSKAGYCCWH